jgi:hypothetical protein
VERGDPRPAQPLEAGELRLYGHARVTGGLYCRAAVQLNGRGGELARVAAAAIAHGLDRDRPERGWVGVEAEDDLTAPLLDERGKPVREGENASDSTAGGLLPAGLGLIRRSGRG